MPGKEAECRKVIKVSDLTDKNVEKILLLGFVHCVEQWLAAHEQSVCGGFEHSQLFDDMKKAVDTIHTEPENDSLDAEVCIPFS